MRHDGRQTAWRALKRFFSDHLPGVRGASPHTTHSYRDALSLLLRFLADHQRQPVVELSFEDLSAENVLAFLRYLEIDRGNSISTRNTRLAAIHTFARYAAAGDPEHLETCQRLVAIPFKRTGEAVVEYLDADEVRAILSHPDRSSIAGRRDHALILTLFNTGARVSEVVGLRARDLRLGRPRQVRLMGKGRKERICPLWAETTSAVRTVLAEGGQEGDDSVFRNHRGQPITRFGIRYILQKHARGASNTAPTLRSKRVSPHTMRHTAAVHLLQAGVDMVTISHWLGHASVETTNRYTAIDMAAKLEALEKAGPIGTPEDSGWRRDADIVAWLEAL